MDGRRRKTVHAARRPEERPKDASHSSTFTECTAAMLTLPSFTGPTSARSVTRTVRTRFSVGTGYTRIRWALSNLGHEIARTTVKRILHDHGIDLAPERSRRMPWKTFLQAHGEGLTACDRFTVEVLTLAGLQRYLVFFVIALQSRRVTIAGIHP